MPEADHRVWEAVDGYFAGLLVEDDAALAAAIDAAAAAGLPPHEVSPAQGKLLHLLALALRPQRMLEIGTLGGYSTIWLARALEPGGRMVTLEVEPDYARVAEANLARAGLADAVDVRVGPAADTLRRLAAEGAGPFDVVFIDADKRGNAEYLDLALRLARPGTLLVADNVVRGGAVVDGAAEDASLRGVRRFTEALAAEPRISATAVQTVGANGYDGFVLAVVTG